MGKFLDSIATQHRKWEVISTAVFMLGILAWGGYKLKSVELVNVTSDSATVTKVTKFGGGQVTSYIGKLQLSDGSSIELLLVQPTPEVGDVVPLRVEHLKDKSKHYSVDAIKWQTEGSQATVAP